MPGETSEASVLGERAVVRKRRGHEGDSLWAMRSKKMMGESGGWHICICVDVGLGLDQTIHHIRMALLRRSE
jgi:hypothetical protein